MNARALLVGIGGLWLAITLGACSDGERTRDDESVELGPEDPDPANPDPEVPDPEGDEPSSGEPFPPSDRTPRPSAACGPSSAAPLRGTQMLSTGGQMGRYYIAVPAGYDPSQPNTLNFVFHGANNDEFACRSGGNCAGIYNELEPVSIVVYMKSFGTSWTGPERDQNVTFFDDLLGHVKANYCVDERRVFAVGTSSGAHFSNILACRRGGDLLGIVPGAGERLETTNCSGLVAALVIHGVDDTSVPFAFGEAARDFYRTQNGCSDVTVPELATIHAEVRAARAANMTTYRCADYQGCMDGLPVRWCEHSDPGYDSSTHGWPGVGGELTWDFIQDL